MGIVSRFKEIMAANANAALDKAEDPEKMMDQSLREMEADFAKVKAETATILANETASKRKLDDCDAEINKMNEYAKKAITAGNDDEAKQFLSKKADLTAKRAILEKDYVAAGENSKKMRDMHDKLEVDIRELRTKRDMLKAKVRVAETMGKMNEIGTGTQPSESARAAFDRMEDKVDKMLDEQNAMAQLNDESADDPTVALEEKYSQQEQDSNVDDELAKLKAEMGK